MAHRSSSPNASSLSLSSRTVALAGATATLATAGALQAFKTAPRYEGSIQLVGMLPEHTSSLHASAAVESAALSPDLANANIAPPDLIQSVQADVLHDSAMAAVVSAQLKKQGLMVTPANLLNRLQSRTSVQGWLELHYQDTDPQRVHAVLEQVAQWYASQDSNCEIQACRDVSFIDAQMPILQQQKQRLEQEGVALQQKLRKTVAIHTSQTAKVKTIEEYSEHLLTQQHQQIRHIAHVEKNIADTLTTLQNYQAQMNLSTVKVQTGFALLRRIIPEYQEWLVTWQNSDRQLLMLSFSQEGETFHESTAQASADTSVTALTALSQQQQSLQSQMNHAVTGITQGTLVDMPPSVRELILNDVGRFEYVGDWLATVHRLQLLDLRRQTLKQMQQDTVAQAQEWKQATAIRDQLKQELATTTETLAKYQQRYVIAQQQAAKESLAWQVVSPPEVVQEPGGLSLVLSSLSQTHNPLMTLRLP